MCCVKYIIVFYFSSEKDAKGNFVPIALNFTSFTF